MDFKLDDETSKRMAAISETTGMDINVLANHIVRDGLSRIDAGGGFSISIKDGSIKYGMTVPQAMKSAAERQAPAMQIDPVTGAPYREINLKSV